MKRHVFVGNADHAVCIDCTVERKLIVGEWFYLWPGDGCWSRRRPDCASEVPRDIEPEVRP